MFQTGIKKRRAIFSDRRSFFLFYGIITEKPGCGFIVTPLKHFNLDDHIVDPDIYIGGLFGMDKQKYL
jgi:hypothetical protein